jgi:phage terminase small subunit
MRGRKPKPTALKILSGDQPCRINRREPILPAASGMEPPDWIGSFGIDLWRRLAPVLVPAGLLTAGDLPAFEQLCQEYDTIRRNKLCGPARDRYRRLLVEFGLTPSARSRLKSAVEPPKDKLATFLARKV